MTRETRDEAAPEYEKPCLQELGTLRELTALESNPTEPDGMGGTVGG